MITTTEEALEKQFCLRQRPGINRTWYCYFKYLGKQYQRSTKTTDREKAYRIGQMIYDEITLSGDPDKFEQDRWKPKYDQEYRKKPKRGPAPYKIKSGMTWDEIEESLRWQNRSKRPWSDDRIRKRILAWKSLARFWGKPYYDITSDDITQESVDDLYDWLCEKYAIKTVQYYLAEFRLSARGAGKSDIYIPNIQIPGSPFEAPDPKVMESIWEDRHDLRMDAFRMLMLTMGAGLRRGEASHARWEWLKPLTCQLKVTQEDGWTTKSHQDRTVPIFKQCMQELLESRDHLEEDSDYILGSPFDPEWYYTVTAKNLGHWLKGKGFLRDGRPVHGLRKYYGSVIATKTGSLLKAQKALGHASYVTTEKNYTALLDSLDAPYEDVF